MAIIDIYTTDRQYGTVLADPPWPYRNKNAGRTMRNELAYPTMSIVELEALPIERLALPDAELWLWATNPFIPEAIGLVRAWGFTYKSMRTWAKPQPGRQGTGFWLIGQTEQLIVAVRGHPRGRVQRRRGQRNDDTPSSLLTTRHKLPHSRKPRESYEDIERVSPAPRLELFARRARKGWDAWGFDAKEYDEEFASDLDANLT